MAQAERYRTEGRVVGETMKARKIFFTSIDEEHWVPTSQLNIDELPENGNLGQIDMSAWIAKKIGLI